MGTFSLASKKIRGLEFKVARLEKLVDTFRSKYSSLNNRCMAIIHNQRHYLRHRAKKVDKRQASLMRAAQSVAKKLKRMPEWSKIVSGTSCSGRRHVLFVTNNHARKLRALADLDLRPLLNSKANHGPETRVRLAVTGGKTYKKTE